MVLIQKTANHVAPVITELQNQAIITTRFACLDPHRYESF